jgi:hypothetical protein
MPSTRFGYLLYPVALLAWVPALRDAAHPMPRDRVEPATDGRVTAYT